MEKKVILVVDDEEHILDLLEYNLQKENYAVLRAGDGEQGLKLLREEQVDLVLLDWMLPGIDGMEVLRQIRREKRFLHLPVIMLTARGEEIDKVLGLELGADDYISKPFGVRELLARVKAHLRRSAWERPQAQEEAGDAKNILRLGELVVDYGARELWVRGKKVPLSRKEFELLYLLASHRNQVFGREQLLDLIWGYEYMGETRTVDVHIRNLRRKIEEEPEQPIYIQTVRGVGYKLV
ncbi:MAG: response regulator transcription factor [Lachnospiraceae bacterium]|nr:response regulator transcription factor [Lachnospiraceae bacterium]